MIRTEAINPFGVVIQNTVQFFWNFLYIVKRMGKEQKRNFFSVSSVVPEIWVMLIWTSSPTPLSEPERQLLVPYSTKANAFCGLHVSLFPIFFLPKSQKAFAFVEYGTRSCLSGSDRGVIQKHQNRRNFNFFSVWIWPWTYLPTKTTSLRNW